MKFSESTNYKYPTVVRHQGVAIALALAKETIQDSTTMQDSEVCNIYYRVLALDPAQPDDEKCWRDVRKLAFPDSLRPAGMSLVTVDLKAAEKTADAPFQALSDGKHVYLFRQSIESTLYVDRFVFDPAQKTLTPNWEARFQRSRKRDLPASRKDTLGARTMEGESFFEPTTELPMVRNLEGGQFSVLLLPGRLPSEWRWQVFAANAGGEIDAYSIRRSEDGLFDIADIKRTCFKWTDGWGRFQTGPAALLYMQQEEAQDEYGRTQRVKRGARVMLAAPVGSSRYALELDGVNDYVEILPDASLDVGDAFTIEAWVKPAAGYGIPQDGHIDIVSRWGSEGASNAAYLLGVTSSGHPLLWTHNGSESSRLESKDALAIDSWSHVAGVLKDGTLSVYINGSLNNSLPGAVAPQPSHYPLRMGAQPAGDAYFKGQINNVRLWNAARSQADIQQGMHGRLTGDEPGLVSYWPFDEGAGDTIYDRAFENHGQLHVGYLLELDGIDDYVSIPHHDSIDFDKDDDFTVAVWIRTAAQQKDITVIDNMIVEKWSGADGYPYVIRYLNRTYGENAGRIVVGRYDGDENPGIISNIVVNDGKFHHVVFVKDGAALYLYIDGSLEGATTDTTTGSTKNDSPLYVGVRGGAQYPFSGHINNLRIWDRGLSIEEIRDDMERPAREVVGAVGNWAFDEGSGDTIHDRASGHHGQLHVGYFLEFDGVDDYVELPDMNPNYVNGFTVEAWVRYSSFQSWSRIIDFGNGAPGDNILFANLGLANDLVFQVYRDWIGSTITAPGALEPNTWMHLAATVDGAGNAALYRDGQLLAPGPMNVPKTWPRTKNYVGRSNWAADGYFDGGMRELRVWNVARSQAEIQTTMNEPLSGDEPGLVGYWPLDEGSGDTIHDHTSADHHGRLCVGCAPDSHALFLDGADDYIELPDMNPDYANGFTVEAWVRYHSFQNWSRIIDFGNGPSQDNILLANGAQTNNLEFHVFRDGAQTRISAPGALEANTWMHLAATVDGEGQAALYKNGQRLAAGSINAPATLIRTKNYMGRSNWATDSYFDGGMGQVRVWNIARSEAEIQATMYQPLSGQEPGLVGCWPLDEGSGDLVGDKASGNDGQLHVGIDDSSDRKWGQGPDNPDEKWGEGPENPDEKWGQGPDDPNDKWVVVPPIAVLDFGVSRQGTLARIGDLPDGSEVTLGLAGDDGPVTLAIPRIEAETDGTGSPMRVIDVDDKGLTVSAGLLDFARTGDTPFLLDSADGLIHLYFRGDGGDLLVAQYDTLTARAQYALPLNEGDGGPKLLLTARRPGTQMQGYTISISDGSDAQTCQVALQNKEEGIQETWQNIPRDLEKFLSVLNGTATSDASDPLIEEGELVFYDYENNVLREGVPDLTSGDPPFFGSALFAAGADNLPDTGAPIAVGNGDAAETTQPGQDCAWTPEPEGKALQFDGLDGYVQLPHDKLNIAGDLALEAWVNVTDAGSGPLRIVDCHAEDSRFTLGLIRDETGADYRVFAGSGDKAIQTGDARVSPGEWTHLAAVYNATTALSLDGQGYVDCGNDPALDVSEAVTVEAWVTPERERSERSQQEVILSKWGRAEGEQSWRLYIDTDGKPCFETRDRNREVIAVKANRQLEAGQSYHLAGVFDVSSKKEVALELDRTNQYVILGNPRSLQIARAITIEAWVKVQATDGERSIVARASGATLRIKDGKYQLGVGGNHASADIAPHKEIGTWVHLAGVYDSEQKAWILYRNGIEVSRHLDDTGALQAGGNWEIGHGFQGQINNVRIWNRARSREEILENMDKPAGNVQGAAGNWAFDEVDKQLASTGKVQDHSGQGNEGSLQGSPTFVDDADKGSYAQRILAYQAGKETTVALDFDGVDDYVELPDLNPDYANGFTVEAWVRYHSFQNWSRIIDFGNGPSQDNILLANGAQTNNLEFHVFQGGAQTRISAPGALEANTWMHLAATVDGEGQAALYKNGQRLVAGPINAPTTLIRTKNYIGRSNWATDSYFDGGMGQVRVWNIARSEAEIQATMYQPLSGDEVGLVGCWPLDETDLQVGRVPDHSDHGNDGVLHGGTLSCIDSGESTSWRWVHKVDIQVVTEAALGADDTVMALSMKPNITTGDTLLIEDEQVRVLSVPIQDSGRYSFEIERGVNGTAACDHPIGTRLYRLLKPADNALLPTTTRVNMGRSASEEGYFRGTLDEVRIWKAGRRDGQIQHFRAHPLPGDAEGLVGHWDFEEVVGSKTAVDRKGSNHGRLIHMEADKIPEMWTPSPRNATLVLYIHGRAVQTSDKDSEPDDYGGYGREDQFTLGAMIGEDETLQQHLAGCIDEVRVWSAVRSAEQIRDNMYRSLSGAEEGLAGYWPLDEGTGTDVHDQTGNGQDGTLQGQGLRWVDSTAPIGNEGPEVRNVYGGLPKPDFNKQIAAPPAAVEYGDMQWDDEGNLFGVMKRCYLFREDAIQLVTGFKVGDLELNFIGQVQTAPTLIGYIEGAPPVPSENLTVNDPVTDDYVGTSAIQLTEAKDTTQVYSASRDTGFDMSVDVKAGLYFTETVQAGLGIQKKLLEYNSRIGLHAYFDHSLSWLSDARVTAGVSKTLTKSLILGGGWEELQDYDQNGQPRYLNPEVGRRYLPNNMGYALVKSGTADLFALRLKSTGSLVAFQVLPNPDIPEDWNIIMFPLDPKYVKNGTLDGMVGLVADADYPGAIAGERGSYFKPLEAYALKEQIERQASEIEGYYESYGAGAKGRTGSTGAGEGELLDELPEEELGYDWEAGRDKRSMANTYVWTADGGFYAEEEQFSSIRQESLGGSYHFLGKAGIFTELKFAVSAGFFLDLDALFGGHVNVTVSKSKEEKATFGLHVDVQGERYLNRWDGDPDKQQGHYTAEPCPGKVDGYRFMTFYLQPKPQNFDRFFGEIVDSEWLNGQGKYAGEYNSNARALREARSKPNEVWRVLHRVTYVSRIPPQFEPTPVEAVPEDVRRPANVEANMGLIREIERIKRWMLPGPDESDLMILGRAADRLLFGDTSGDGQGRSELEKVIPWWADRDEPVKREIRQDVMTYLKAFYESDLTPPQIGEDEQRVTEGLQALYTFEEGQDKKMVQDVSGVEPLLNLRVKKKSAVEWLRPSGLDIREETLVTSLEPATKLMEAAKASNEITIEAWVKPADADQGGPARIVTLSADPHERNFTLGQDGEGYQTRLRTTQTNDNGTDKALEAGDVATDDLSHLVYVREASGEARFYLNGVQVGQRTVGGDFSNWDDGYRFGLGNEFTNDRPWLGELHLVAIYSRALGPAEVEQNYRVGARITQ